MAPLVTIVTPTYNKPHWFAECAAAVLAQTFTDWVWWVVFNFHTNDTFGPKSYNINLNDHRVLPIYYPVSPSRRDKHHIPARIVNWLYPKVTTPYIYFLADDDLIDPDGLQELVKAAEPVFEMGMGTGGRDSCKLYTTKKRYDAVYGRCDVQSERPDGSFEHVGWLHPGADALSADELHVGWRPEHYNVGLGGPNPDCLIDGGQVLHTQALWDNAPADRSQ